MRTIKIKPFLITFIISLAVITMLWFGYLYFGVQKPLNIELQGANYSTAQYKADSSTKMLYISLTPDTSVSLDKAVHELSEIISKSKYSNYTVNFEVISASNDPLDSIWSHSLFQMADMMANKRYANIPQYLNQLQLENKGLQVDSAIDDRYVYITLRDEAAIKYILLPLKDQTMEVWNHA